MSAITPWTTGDDRRLAAAMAAGATLNDVAMITGRTHTTVRSAANRLGIARQRNGGRRTDDEVYAMRGLIAELWGLPYSRPIRHVEIAPPPPAISEARELRQRNAATAAAWRERQRDPRPAPWESAA